MHDFKQHVPSRSVLSNQVAPRGYQGLDGGLIWAQICRKVQRDDSEVQSIRWWVFSEKREFQLRSAPIRLAQKQACGNIFLINDCGRMTQQIVGGATHEQVPASGSLFRMPCKSQPKQALSSQVGHRANHSNRTDCFLLLQGNQASTSL